MKVCCTQRPPNPPTHLTVGFSQKIHIAFLHMKFQCFVMFMTVIHTRVGTLIVATIYLQQIQNRYTVRSFTVLHCSHQHCVQPVASDVEVIGYL